MSSENYSDRSEWPDENLVELYSDLVTTALADPVAIEGIRTEILRRMRGYGAGYWAGFDFAYSEIARKEVAKNG